MKKTGLQGYRKNFIKFLSVFMVIFPWITYMNIYELTESEKTVYSSYEGIWIDVFIESKQIVLLIVAAIALLWFVGERFLPEKVDNNIPLFKGKNKWLFALSGVFAIGTIISTLTSQYMKDAIWGAPMIGEGLWSLLAYIIIIFAFFNSFANEYGFTIFKKAMSVLCGITVVLAFIEKFYKPLLEINLVQKLVAPEKFSSIMSSLEASRFSDAISLTFYNPAYFGGFVCLLFPFSFSFCLQGKQTKEKVLYGIIAIGLLFCVIAAGTTTALLVVMFEVFLIVIALFLMVQNKRKAVVQGAIAFSVVLVGLLVFGEVSGNSFFNILSNNNSVTMDELDDTFEITDIQMQDNVILLNGEKYSLEISYEDENCIFQDRDGNVLEPIRTEEGLVFEEEGYENLKIIGMNISGQIDGVEKCLRIEAGYLDPIDFFILENGMFSGVGQGGAIIMDIGDAGTPDSLKKYYGLFTGRGYAWINSVPILKETFLIGKGAGTFAYYFKHFDYTGMLTTHKTVKQMIDKPHNAYLQYMIEHGIPAALSFFGIFFGALVMGIKNLLKKRKQNAYGENSELHIASMVAVVGFLICSVINDSMITVTPIACMIAGVLLASCYKMEHEK